MIEYKFIYHFPHQMQHIYPCWSLWRHFPNAKHVFLSRPRYHKDFVSGSAFTKGVQTVLKANNITTISVRMVDYIRWYRSNPSELLVAYTHRVDGFRAAHDDDMESLRRNTLTVFGMEQYIERYCGRAQARMSSHNQQDTSPISNADSVGDDASHHAPPSPPRIAIVNRGKTRQMFGMHNISSMLQHELELPYRPPVFFLEDTSFQQQVEAFSNVDILLSPHGAQLTLIPFMPPCSSVIEVIPHGYGHEAYFGTLAALSGVNHSFIYLGTDMAAETAEMDDREGQVAARNPPVCAPAFRMLQAIRIQYEQWHRCCRFDANTY
uniref:Glycosyltransferase 61 catalytic domain-containing protein n=1 Tax=Craspedostauros australis TaxID=1486917 RepID=A0A7R9WXW5_9STRA